MGVELSLDAFEISQYLYLRDLSEPRDNALRIVVQEAVVNREGVVGALFDELPELAALRKNAAPIESTSACRSIELAWNRYVAYLVTEEGVGSCGQYDDEIFSGRLFRIYESSHFLQHLARDTGGHESTLLHYKLICLNHMIDVAAYEAPEIRIVEPSLRSRSVH